MSAPRSFDELLEYLKQRDLAAKAGPGRQPEYPYFAGLPYPTWPLFWELVAEEGGWSVIAHDHYSQSHLVRAGPEDVAVEGFMRAIAHWAVTSEHVREALEAYHLRCAREEQRQEELRQGTYLLRLPRRGTPEHTNLI